MYYEINVAKNGEHYFATAERSIRTEEKAKEVLQDFKTKFPENEGFSFMVTRWETIGKLQEF